MTSLLATEKRAFSDIVIERVGELLPARRLEPKSAWKEHVPFGMLLVSMLRPRVLVELGTELGVAYCAFCQVIRQLELPAKAFAIDTWQGDPQAGV